MVGAELNCPFCNAALSGVVRSASGESASGERVVCPRCREPLPDALAAQLPSTPLPAPASTPTRSPVPGKTKTLLAILAVMALMALTAGIFAWTTKDFRRRNDYRTQKAADPETKSAAAADAAIVGFLPAKCNVVAALNVAALRQQAATRRLLDEPPLGAFARQVPRWTGLAWTDIDQIALGAEVTAKLPQLFIVVQTRQPYPAGKAAAALAPAVPTQHRNKTLVRFPLQPVGEGLLWRHSEQILVFVLGLDAVVTDDLDAIPSRPRPGLEGFAAPLRAALTERLPPVSAGWLAGHLGEPTGLAELLALTGQKHAALDMLLQTKTFVVSVQTHDQATLTGHFFTGSVKSRAKLQAFLESLRGPEATSLQVAGPPPDVTEPEAQWVTVQARGDLSAWLAASGPKRE